MHSLIVVSHPEPRSLTHALATAISEGVSRAANGNSAEIADLAAEGFRPSFTRADVAVHLRRGKAPADVRAEQARIDRADDLVLVYPVFWWSMPALLKGWIDRVFSNGWAYDYDDVSGVVKRLDRLRVHLVSIGGADDGTWTKYGYRVAMQTQIDTGIFDYCGARVVSSDLMLDSADRGPSAHLDAARRIGERLFLDRASIAA